MTMVRSRSDVDVAIVGSRGGGGNNSNIECDALLWPLSLPGECERGAEKGERGREKGECGVDQGWRKKDRRVH